MRKVICLFLAAILVMATFGACEKDKGTATVTITVPNETTAADLQLNDLVKSALTPTPEPTPMPAPTSTPKPEPTPTPAPKLPTPSFSTISGNLIIRDIIYWVWYINRTDDRFYGRPENELQWFDLANDMARMVVYNHLYGSSLPIGFGGGDISQNGENYESGRANHEVLKDLARQALNKPLLLKGAYLAKRNVIVGELKARGLEREVKKTLLALAPYFQQGWKLPPEKQGLLAEWWNVNCQIDEKSREIFTGRSYTAANKIWDELGLPLEHHRDELATQLGLGDTLEINPKYLYAWIGRRYGEGGQLLLDAYAWCLRDLASRL